VIAAFYAANPHRLPHRRRARVAALLLVQLAAGLLAARLDLFDEPSEETDTQLDPLALRARSGYAAATAPHQVMLLPKFDGLLSPVS